MAHFEEEIEITADASSLERAGEESQLVLDRLRRKLAEVNADIAKTGERTPGLEKLQDKLKDAIRAAEEYILASETAGTSTEELSDKARKAARAFEDLDDGFHHSLIGASELAPALEMASAALDHVADEAERAGDNIDRAGDKAEIAAAKFSLLGAIGGMGGIAGLMPLLGILGGAPFGAALGGGLLGAGGGLLGALGGGAAGLGGLGVSGIGLGLIISQALKLALNTSGSATFGGMKFKIPTAPVAGLADAMKELQAAIGPILVALRGLGGGVIGALVKGAHAILPQISKELVGFIHDITPLAERLATSLLGLAAKIIPLVLRVMRVFTPQLMQAINRLAPAVLGLFRALIPLGEVFNSALGRALFHLTGSLTQFFKLNRDQLATFIRQLFMWLTLLGDQLLSLMQATLPLGTELIGLISQFLTIFIGALTRFLIKNGPLLANIMAGLFRLLGQLVPIFFQILTDILPLAPALLQIARQLVPLLRKLLPLLPPLVHLIIQLVPIVIEVIKALTKFVAPVLVGSLTHVINLASRVVGLYRQASGIATNAIQAIGGFFSRVGQAIGGRFMGTVHVLAAVAAVAKTAVEAAMSAVQGFVDAVKHVIDSIVGFFGSIHIPDHIHIPGTPIDIPLAGGGIIAGAAGFVTRGPTYLVGEGNGASFGPRGRGDEAVIPLNSQGVDVLAQALGKALTRAHVGAGGRSGSRVLQLHIPWEQIRRGVITIVDDEVGFRVGA